MHSIVNANRLKPCGTPNPQLCAASSLSTSAMTSFSAQSSVPPSAFGSCDGWMNSSSRQCDAGESDSTSAQQQTHGQQMQRRFDVRDCGWLVLRAPIFWRVRWSRNGSTTAQAADIVFGALTRKHL